MSPKLQIPGNLKSKERPASYEVQLVKYLNGLEKEIGLLINFGPTGVEVKRKYRKPNQKAQSLSAESG